jgi:hypothetical protein
MPIYTLYLTTKITGNSPLTPIFPQPISPATTLATTQLSNVTWNIDWDNLFRRNNYNYTGCRLRFDLVSESFTASSPATSDWTAYSGYLAVSIPSNYNSITTNSTILGQIWPQDCPVTGTSIHSIGISTMSENGVDVNVPSGSTLFNIQMIKGDGFVPMANFQHYNILLSFELYNL